MFKFLFQIRIQKLKKKTLTSLGTCETVFPNLKRKDKCRIIAFLGLVLTKFKFGSKNFKRKKTFTSLGTCETILPNLKRKDKCTIIVFLGLILTN